MTVDQMQESGLMFEDVMRQLGIPTQFKSTKGKEVPDGNIAFANIKSARKHRQVMNRAVEGGRALVAEATRR